MKSAIPFVAGTVVGALFTWFVFSKDVMLVPTGTTLVEVDRFNGSAREVHYSSEEALQLRREEGVRMLRAAGEWEKAHPSPQIVDPEADPFDSRKTAPELSVEELAQVKFTATVKTDQNPCRLECSIYNGTGKTLVRAQAHIEGIHKDSGSPLARNVEIPLSLKPSTDTFAGVHIDGGYIDPSKVEGLKVTLVKAQGR